MASLIKKILPVILLSYSVSLLAQPVQPDNVTASQTTICQGVSVTLSYSGGSGDTFHWYSASCGGTPVGTGNDVLVMPSVTTTYYGRWETATEQSPCLSVTVTVIPSPTAASSVGATQTTLCSGASTILSYTGGSGDTFNWYANSCGGTFVGTGNNLMVTPSVTTTYYGQWTNSCGSSICQSVTITVNPSPVAPSSVNASLTSVCEGGSTVLSYTGGSGDTFNWYSGSCGGTFVGSGNNLTVYPSANTTYYGRWENGCGGSTCLSVTVTVDALPTNPSSVNASQTSICEGEFSILSYTGGSGAAFYWYSGSCGGTLVGSGNNLYVYPTETTTYYGRWETGCGNSICLSVTVNVTPLPTPPISVDASMTSVCEGGSTILSYAGGSGNTFNWYSGSCGGTFVGTGNNITVTPAVNTTYYGRWENSCGGSACLSVTVTVDALPTAPSAVNASQTSICEGDYTILTYTGGSGAAFYWYSGACGESGGTYEGAGNNLYVYPTETTTYYGQWETGCGVSICQSVTVTVTPLATPPLTVTATFTSVCAGGSTTLSYSGGSGDTFNWYANACGGTLVGTGNNLTVTPAANTSYYGRWENSCGGSMCASVDVTVDPLPTAPSAVNASQTTICEGEYTVLSFVGGSGATFNWFSGSCGGPPVGSGNNLYVYPTVTTTYFGQWETGCGTSLCQSVTVTVNPLPVAPVSVNASQTSICEGGSVTLTYSGGSGTTFNWYAGGCGGTALGSGNNFTVSPTVTTTYYGRWESSCGNSGCQTVTVNVDHFPVAPTQVNSSSTSICFGDQITLSSTGGSGTTFNWYTGSCEGAYMGSGETWLASPSATTTYYGQWETSCGSSTCESVIVEVGHFPELPSSLNASETNICQGESTTLYYVGGSGDVFTWYTGACGGNVIGTGNNIVVSPTITTTYYGNWSSDCGTGACLEVTVYVSQFPTPASSVSATRTNICYGESTLLRYTGGSGDTFWWYAGSCEGNIAGTGNNLSVSPYVTTTYYGLWETDCGITACDTVTVYVTPFVTGPASVNTSKSFICDGDSAVLTYYGGDGDTFYWYADWCRGTLVGTGNNLTVKPTTYTTYYGAWENSCFQSECTWVSVDVGDYPTAPTDVSAVQTSVCEGESTSLTYSGGSGDSFFWYAGACGGSLVGAGNYVTIYPSYTTTYYGLWETDCGRSECDTVTVEVVPYAETPWSVSASRTTICRGESTTLSYTGGAGETFVWYKNNCRGTRVGTGNNLVVSPTEFTTYYGAWENRCYHSDCVYVSVDVETDCDPSGISLPEMAGLNIYPNPTTDQIFITSTEREYEDVELSINDMSGKVILTKTFGHFGAGINYSVDLRELPYGIYFIKIGNSEFVSYEKIIKQ